MPRRAQGIPVHCGMCDKPVIAGLWFAGRAARQAMTPYGTGRMHIDRELCKALEEMTDEKFAGLYETRKGGDGLNERHDLLHPTGDLGLDRDGNETEQVE